MNKPGGLAWTLLRLFCPEPLLEEIEGDLLERYDHDARRMGSALAKRRLLWNALRYCRPGILFRHKMRTYQPLMLTHYIKFYFRNAARNRQAALTSLIGLVIGISGAWLMGLFVEREADYDQGPYSANTYRLVFGESDELGSVATPHVLATEIGTRFPGVTPMRFTNAGGARINFFRGETRFMESAFFFTDAESLVYFPFGMIEGEPAKALTEPFTIVLTKRAAIKYFGDEDPVGQTISLNWINESYELKITGLIDERQNQSHIQFDYLISMATAERLFRPETYFTDWTGNFSVDYIMVENAETARLIDSELTQVYKTHQQNELPADIKLRLQPVSRIHLHSHLSRELGRNGDVKYVYLASCIGFLLIVVSLINYINVLSAVFVVRLKEVGVRKSMGAGVGSILRQFLMESMMHVTLAAILSGALILVIWPFFAQWAGLSGDYEVFLRPVSLWVLGALAFSGVVAAVYPALLVSRQQAATILYGSATLTGAGSWTRQALVTFQVFIALLILCGSLIVRNQLAFIHEKDLGYRPDQLISIPQGRSIRNRSEQVKQELLQTGQVVSATISSTMPSRSLNMKVPAHVTGGNPDATEAPWPVALVSVDYDFFETFGLEIVEGRSFSPLFPSDSLGGLIINEAALRALGWTAPLGNEMKMTYNAGDGTVETRTGQIIGVVKDFNFESLHKSIEPVVFFCKPFWYYYLTLRLKPGEPQEVLLPIREKWMSLVPGVPFEYEWVTERIDNLYTDENKWGAGIDFFSGIAMLVSSLGLLGLISFYLNTRMKELAVRKVLGAGTASLTLRVYGQMIKLLALASIPALPLAWWLGTQWISGFAYRAPIGTGVFFISVLILLVISTVAVGGRIFRAARTNPVAVLKAS